LSGSEQDRASNRRADFMVRDRSNSPAYLQDLADTPGSSVLQPVTFAIY
jgi:hypothetical protein